MPERLFATMLANRLIYLSLLLSPLQNPVILLQLARIRLPVLVCLLFFGAVNVYGQVKAKKDSTQFYKDLRIKSKRNKFTKWLFETVIVMRKEEKPMKKVRVIKQVTPFKAYEGKIIRFVGIRVLDPFGHSVNDTARQPRSKLERYANNVHVTSKAFLIKNQLLFDEGETLDILRLSESERILRQAPYISDAHIYVSPSHLLKNSVGDSVDVWVWVQDQWSILPESGLDPTSPNLLMTDINFLGLGTSVRQEVGYSFSDKAMFVRGKYGLFNIRKSFLSTNLVYQFTRDISTFGIQLDRPFYSPLTRWAGGLSAVRTATYFYPLYDSSKVARLNPIQFDQFDVWTGRSWQVERGGSVLKRSTALIAGIRLVNTRFKQRPVREIDTHFQNMDQTTLLASFGISRREFYKEKYLYRFGANEDVPIGFSLQAITGHQFIEFQGNHYYLGISGAFGGYIKSLGYFSALASYGNYFNKTNLNRGIIRGNINFFSHLAQVEDWSVRQFASLNTVFGIDREAYEFVNINGSQLYGFNSKTVRGKSKAIMTFETVFYMPYNVLGFRLAPVLFVGLAKIGDNMHGLLNSQIFQAYTIGLLVRNENLIFKTFELSIGLYPYLPGGTDGIRFNPVSSYRLKVRDFALPKPEVLIYD